MHKQTKRSHNESYMDPGMYVDLYRYEFVVLIFCIDKVIAFEARPCSVQSEYISATLEA